MKISLSLFALTCLLMSMQMDTHNHFPLYPSYEKKGFDKGELTEYEMSYLGITIGKAVIKVHPKTYMINQRACYKIDVYGKSSGVADWIAQINDNWGAYVDTTSLVPHIAYRNIEEGKYRKKEIVKFDHKSSMLEVKTLNNKTGEFKEPEYYQFLPEVREMISGFSFIRSMDIDSLQIGDMFSVSAFFEDTFYDFHIRYEGKEVLKTKFGKINCIVMKPIMPNNKVFEGENAITVWFSDDDNKLPLKIEANLVIGRAGLKVTNIEHLKYPFNFESKEEKQAK